MSVPRPHPGATDPRLDDFCREEWPRLVGALTLYVADRPVAEELAQEALVRLCMSWSKVRAMQSPGAWLHRVGLNLANDRFRRLRAERRAHERAESGRHADAQDHAEEVAVREAVARLPRRQKTAIILRFFLDLSVDDTARLMECPENTVKSLTRRGLRTLQGVPGISLEEAT